MSISQLSLILQSSIGILALVLLWFIWVSAQRVDALRGQMFSIRNELFDFARAGNIDFQDPAYNLLRNAINAFIRYAHRLTFFQLILTVARWKMTEELHPLTWNVKWEEALAALPTDIEEQMRRLHSRAMDDVASHLVLGSPLFTVPVLVSMLSLALIQKGSTSVRDIFREAAENMVTRILGARRIEELAVRA